MDVIYFLLTDDDWQRVRDEAVVATPGPEGFVHCCEERQIAGVRAAFFPPNANLVALRLDPIRLEAETRYEPGSRGEAERFPHVHGPIRRVDVVDLAAVPNP